MAILTRQTQKVFAGNANADQIAIMGTMKTGSPQYSTSLSSLQSASYELGWDDAIQNHKAPYMEEMNGVQFGLSYQIAYLLQEGIPEYDQNTNYSKTSIVKIVENNDLVLYHSLIDDNTGVADITTSANWARLYIADYGRIGEPMITLRNTLPDGLAPENSSFVWLDGSVKSRTTYNSLFLIYGTTYNTGGESSSQFRLPNFTNRALWGYTSLGYIAAGLPNITATTGEAGGHTHSENTKGAHKHNKGDMRIYGQIKTSDSDDEPLLFSDNISSTGALNVGGRKEWAHGGAETKSGASYNVISIDSNGYWTGNTNETGGHTHTINAVSNHKHTVSVSLGTAGIMGNSTTVQPPAIKVRVYTRWK